MGLEAESELTTAGQTVHVRALLESHDLILRGAVKKTLPVRELSDPRSLNDQLVFEHGGQSYILGLPPGQADKWLKKLTTEPPSLAAKLGIDATHKAFVTGNVDDDALRAAFEGATTTDPHEATLGIAVIRQPGELSEALAALLKTLPAAPVWIVFPKGAKSPLPESTVRTHLHALGLVDTKSCAVSETLTALRFNKRKTILSATP